MIHQCYFAETQRAQLFSSPVYRGCAISSEINPDLTRNCPELPDRKSQNLLGEYSAMLYLWRNPELDADPWIGFTSYRQLDKSPTIFQTRDEVEAALASFDVVGWGGARHFDALTGRPISMAEQGERFHPGLIACLYKLLMSRDETFPREYLVENTGLYCNYWVMSKAKFNEYMSWSYPLVRWCLDNYEPYIASHPRSVSVVVERLFICWCALRGQRLGHVGEVRTMRWLNPFSEKSESAEVTRVPLVKLSNWSVSLLELCRRHRVAPRGIIHIGAHYAEERELYRQLGLEDVLWIEADPGLIPQLSANIAAYRGHRAIQACLSNVDDQRTPFYRTNNYGESSSILPMGTHRDEYPQFHVVDEIALSTSTFAKLVEREAIELGRYDFAVLDVQGAELMALQGFGDLLRRFTGVYLEVNLKHLYQGCALLPEIDAYLASFGFSRRETLITRHEYGDAFFLRDEAFAPAPAVPRDRLASVQLDLASKRMWSYRVSGQLPRTLELLDGGEIGPGKTEAEQQWMTRAAGHDLLLEFVGAHGRSCYMRQESDGVWRGESLVPRRAAAELLSGEAAATPVADMGFPNGTNRPL